ncbi:MAG TPA: hypothetical protein PLQ56_24660 [Aggregatilineales bacterium]|jgi:hypothetical protein|nr:hypothetical protein [Anaerolineae bacterium]HUN09819.1 hypothetical protein [Aggregatilineales bacterium]
MSNLSQSPYGDGSYTPDDRTEMVNPIAASLQKMLERKAARPQDVYRLAVIMEAVLESLHDPVALETVRGELRVLLNDLSQTMPER